MAKAKANTTSKGMPSAKTTKAKTSKNTSTKQSPVQKMLLMKSPAKKSSIAKTSAKPSPATKSPAKQTSAKQQVITKQPVTLLDEHQDNRDVGIWTPTISQSFYSNVNALSSKLNEYQSPSLPENYRIDNKDRADSEDPGDYTLSYEQELHMADHFAFLAHAAEGVEFVSAVTIEESRNPPSFTVRLASNHTPTQYVKDGLEKILKIVRDHACEGRHGEEYKSKLFDEVVKFSQKRMYHRIRCSRWEKPAYLKGSNPPLHEQIKAHLLRLGTGPLRSALVDLIEALKNVDRGAAEDQTELLKEVICKSHAVSHQGEAKSLDATLRQLRFGGEICESRAVLEIDKLSKYLDLCIDLIRLSRQQATRAYCQDLKLDTCTAYLGSRPLGAAAKCFVHAEVQLILFYEQYPKSRPPRAIGASKSACFLCDLFIKQHRGFGISHSHMKLYTQWTIPNVPWMNIQQIQTWQNIVQAMTLDIKTLLSTKLYLHNAVIESRVHILQVVQSSEIASSLASPARSDQQIVTRPGIRIPTIDSVDSAVSLPLTTISSTLYYFQDLPVIVDILPNTMSCILLVGNVDYIFDLSEVEIGRLLVSECTEAEAVLEDMRVDVRELSSSPKHLKVETTSQNITFHVHDAQKHELQFIMTWGGPLK